MAINKLGRKDITPYNFYEDATMKFQTVLIHWKLASSTANEETSITCTIVWIVICGEIIDIEEKPNNIKWYKILPRLYVLS